MSTVSASINSRQIQQDSQKRLDDEITSLSISLKKGNEEGMLYTVNEMNGNFFETNDEFYNYVSQYRFLDLDTLYSAITQEARVLQKNEIFQNMINDHYNERFMKCLFNFYNNSPSFFKVLFPVYDNSSRANKNTHQAYQKYYYLLCIIDFTMKNKDDEKLNSLPLEFKKNIVNWCITRWDPNIEYQLTGPTGNQTITFDFAKHYQSLISVQNTVTEINDYNKIVKLQNLDDRVFEILNAIVTRNNVYDKNPDYAREYNYNLDSLFLQQKYKDNDGNLIFDLSYVDFGDSTNDTTKSRLEDIDRLKTTDITLSKLNIKKLEKIFNMYSRLKVSSLVVDKNTYITNLSQLKTVYLVFSGISCSDRTIGNNRFVANGDLAIPGTFVINHQGNYEFVPKTEYTSYRSNRTRVKACKIYLTTYGSNLISNNILNSYAINLTLDRLKFYNIPLKIVTDSFMLFANEPYNRFNKFNQFPDIIFNNVDNKKHLNYKSIQRILNEIDNPFWYLKDKIDNEYKTDYPVIKPIKGTILILPYSIINNEIVSDSFVYSYDLDTNIINLQQITNIWPSDNNILNTMLYRIFMKEHLFTSINYITDTTGLLRYPVYTKEEAINTLNEFDITNTNINEYTYEQNNVPLSNEKEYTIRTVDETYEDIQNLQLVQDLLLYLDKNTMSIYNSLQLPIYSYSHPKLITNIETNKEEYYKILDYIYIKLPLTEYGIKIFPDTSSKLFNNDELSLIFGNEITFNYVISSSKIDSFDKCILTINNSHVENLILPFDLGINYNYEIETTNPNASSTPDSDEKDITISSQDLQQAFLDKRTIIIEFEYTVRNFDSSLTITQIKNYITINKFVINHISKTIESDNDEQIFYNYNMPLVTYDVLPSYVIATRYDSSNNTIQLFNRNVENLDLCNTAFRWYPNTNILNYDNITFTYFEHIIKDINSSSLFNPLQSSNFLEYNFNNDILNNNISLIKISDDIYGKKDLEVYNVLENGETTETTTLDVNNCYISTSKDNFSTKTYIENGTLYFNNTKPEIGYDYSVNHDNENFVNNSAEAIEIYNSNEYYNYDINIITKKVMYNPNSTYGISSDYIYGYILSKSETIANNIYKIINENIIDRLKIILTDNYNSFMNPMIGYVVLDYVYRYVNGLYALLTGDDNIIRNYLLSIGENNVYNTFYLLDFPLLIQLTKTEKTFITSVSQEMGLDITQSLDILKLVAKNFEIGIEIYLNYSETVINIYYIYTKGSTVDKVVNKLSYSENDIKYYLANIYYMKASQYDDYCLLYEFVNNISNINNISYTKRKYQLKTIYKYKYSNIFNINNIHCLLEASNQNISITLSNGNIEDIIITFPYLFVLTILARAKIYYVEEMENRGEYKLIEHYIPTAKPSNLYYTINYYDNTYYKLNLIFGNTNYYKRYIYYYKLLYSLQNNNTPIFNTTETLSKHDYVNINYENNTLNNNKNNSINASIDLIGDNLYTIYNYVNHIDPNINNINNDLVNIVLNKSDIELSLTWN